MWIMVIYISSDKACSRLVDVDNICTVIPQTKKIRTKT